MILPFFFFYFIGASNFLEEDWVFFGRALLFHPVGAHPLRKLHHINGFCFPFPLSSPFFLLFFFFLHFFLYWLLFFFISCFCLSLPSLLSKLLLNTEILLFFRFADSPVRIHQVAHFSRRSRFREYIDVLVRLSSGLVFFPKRKELMHSKIRTPKASVWDQSSFLEVSELFNWNFLQEYEALSKAAHSQIHSQSRVSELERVRMVDCEVIEFRKREIHLNWVRARVSLE